MGPIELPFGPEEEALLQNIEAAIIAVYRDHREMLDYDAEAVLEALVSGYAAEQQGRTPRPVTLTGLRRTLYDAVHTLCEWRLGRTSLGDMQLGEDERNDVADLLAALKRIRKSQQRWTKQRGRTGYLDFVSRFV
jgi:hypothetical protein